mmetsp:Transcript_99964/g.214106  ORF Transcript_99964/g.214106 Transcript_99964/m.214106 type:complete len:204 (-) Transcript_99964:196-807(-)
MHETKHRPIRAIDIELPHLPLVCKLSRSGESSKLLLRAAFGAEPSVGDCTDRVLVYLVPRLLSHHEALPVQIPNSSQVLHAPSRDLEILHGYTEVGAEHRGLITMATQALRGGCIHPAEDHLARNLSKKVVNQKLDTVRHAQRGSAHQVHPAQEISCIVSHKPHIEKLEMLQAVLEVQVRGRESPKAAHVVPALVKAQALGRN